MSLFDERTLSNFIGRCLHNSGSSAPPRPSWARGERILTNPRPDPPKVSELFCPPRNRHLGHEPLCSPGCLHCIGHLPPSEYRPSFTPVAMISTAYDSFAEARAAITKDARGLDARGKSTMAMSETVVNSRSLEGMGRRKFSVCSRGHSVQKATGYASDVTPPSHLVTPQAGQICHQA